METQIEESKIIAHRCSKETIEKLFDKIKKSVLSEDGFVATRYLLICNVSFRLIIHDKKLLEYFTKELSYVMLESATEPYDYTIVSWVTQQKSFSPVEHRVIGEKDLVLSMPIIERNETNGRVVGYDDDNRCFYYCFPSSEPEILSKEGHVFFRQFYRVFKKKQNSSLVHGACIGIDGKGVLLCARGNRGKSTLSILALLKGFEYVSDDYLIIEKEGNEIFASPIYSIMTLSHKMYNEMFEDLNGARFISNNWDCSKYIISIANHHDKFRSHYPVNVCMIPEIVDDDEPSIEPCSNREKGRALTNIVHSTISQVGDSSDTANTLKLMSILNDQEYYKIRLSKNIQNNVECLRSFICTFFKDKNK